MSVFVITDFALSSAAIAGICVCALLLVGAAAAAIYYGKHQAKRNSEYYIQITEQDRNCTKAIFEKCKKIIIICISILINQSNVFN